MATVPPPPRAILLDGTENGRIVSMQEGAAVSIAGATPCKQPLLLAVRAILTASVKQKEVLTMGGS